MSILSMTNLGKNAISWNGNEGKKTISEKSRDVLIKHLCNVHKDLNEFFKNEWIFKKLVYIHLLGIAPYYKL